jgi:hypothetical protein
LLSLLQVSVRIRVTRRNLGTPARAGKGLLTELDLPGLLAG